MRTLVAIVVLLIACRAFAQVDPSVYSVGAGGVFSGSDASEIDSGRYVKKKHIKEKKKRRLASENAAAANETPSPAPELQNAQVAPLPGLTGEAFNNDATPQPTLTGTPNPSFGNKMRDLFLGGDLEQMDKYRSFLDNEDIRKNIFEFTLASSYMYNQSSSPYFYRNYIDSSPDAFIGINIWMTPFLAIDADYRTSLLNELKDSPTLESYVTSSHSWFDLGLKFRRFFGMVVNSSSISVGLKYSDYLLSIPPTSLYRSRQHTQGPQLAIDIAVPSGKNYSWLFGINVEPYLNHTEIPGNTDIRAGTDNQTAAFGASLGGEYRFSRNTRAFWKASALVYKSEFHGAALATDPVTGATPSSVPASNAFYLLDLGVTLGR